MAPNIKIFDSTRLILGEGPHWDADAQVLYYVDIFGSGIHKYDWRSEKFSRVVVDKKNKTPVTFVVPVAGTTDKFVIGYGAKVALVTWDGTNSEIGAIKILDEESGTPGNRFNDGKADPNGRLWLGTMGPEKSSFESMDKVASFYSLSEQGKLKKHLDKIGISNGLAWSPDHKTMYYIDSLTRGIDAFDYNIKTGEVANRRTVFDLKKNKINGLPDGMTIDKEGKLWLAVFMGDAIYRIDPDSGTVLQHIPLPAHYITSVVWGGPNLDELFVTCAGHREPETDTNAGRTFKITGLGVSGFPSPSVKLLSH